VRGKSGERQAGPAVRLNAQPTRERTHRASLQWLNFKDFPTAPHLRISTLFEDGLGGDL